MKTLFLIFALVLVSSIVGFAQSQLIVDHVKWYGGKARNQYGVQITLFAGWYEHSHDDGVYTYMLYERKLYRVLKSNARERRLKVKRYNNKHSF